MTGWILIFAVLAVLASSAFFSVWTQLRKHIVNAGAGSVSVVAEAGASRVLALDVSPSMLANDWPPTRLDAAKEAAIAYCRRVAGDKPQTPVGIVAYAGRGYIACPPTPAGDQDRLTRAIGRLKTSGSTNITAGLENALKLIRNAPGISEVILLTDGHHNHGRSPQPVAEELRRIAILQAVGIGGSPDDVDEALLRQLVSSYPDGGKRYRWIGDREKLVDYFDELGGGLRRS